MIYYEYGMLVTYIISKYVEKSEDVEELVNDVFIKFYQASFKTEIKNISLDDPTITTAFLTADNKECISNIFC